MACSLLLAAACSVRDAVKPEPPEVLFLPNDQVQLLSDAPVRAGPNAFASTLGTQLKGATGTITSTPSSVDVDGDNTRYWEVNFPSGADGWVSGIYLTKSVVLPGFYVSTSGGQGTGSFSDPWSLTYALTGAAGKLTTGSTVWLRGGSYVSPGGSKFRTTVSGASGAPITFRAFPGERVILSDNVRDGGNIPLLNVIGNWLNFWGLELTNTSTDRTIASNVIWNQGTHNKFLYLLVYDGGVGLLNESTADMELTGSVFYNNGHQRPDGGTGGHDLYVAYAGADSVVAHDNVMFSGWGYGVHAYHDAGAGEALNNIRIRGNVVFNHGTQAPNYNQGSNNILLGGDATSTNSVVDTNMTYFSPPNDAQDTIAMGTNVRVGYESTLNGTVQVRGNYFVGKGKGSGPVFDTGFWSTATISGNSFIGCKPPPSGVCAGTVIRENEASPSGYSWSNNTHHRDTTQNAWILGSTPMHFLPWKAAVSATDQGIPTIPTITKVFVRKVTPAGIASPEPGRAFVTVYNWGNVGSVSVDLTNIMPLNAVYEIWNVQSLWTVGGSPVVSGTYAGGSVTLPIAGVPAPIAVGTTYSRSQPTGTAFNAYLVRVKP
jgi:hypothetical protein